VDNGQVELGDLPVPDLLVKDAQGLGVLGGHDDAAGVAVDAVAQGRSKGVLVPGIPLLLLVEVGLNVGDEGVHLFVLVRVAQQARPFVEQHQVFILIDDGSTDHTSSIIQSYNDKRVRLIQNSHNFIESLNLGIENSLGKYMARMDGDDIMHIDRLKIQYAIMQEYPDVTVCGTWMNSIGTYSQTNGLLSTLSGWVEQPLLKFTKGNFLFHPTTMIRMDFLKKNALKYENYPYAEDFKFWVEIAKSGGRFYIDSQPLLYYRISDSQVSSQKSSEQRATTESIINEVLEYLMELNKNEYPELAAAYGDLCKLYEKQLLTKCEVLTLFQTLFSKNEKKLNL